MMSETYKIKEIQITVRPGVTVIAETNSVDGVKALIEDLVNADILIKVTALPTSPKESQQQRIDTDGTPTSDDEPISRIETKASLDSGILLKKKVVAFKDGIPQLLKPNAFPGTTDALLVLLFSLETGLQKPSVDYDSFKALFESQNIKSGSPLSMLLTNLRNGNYLDKNKYLNDKKLSLTAKGEEKAIEILKEHCKQ